MGHGVFFAFTGLQSAGGFGRERERGGAMEGRKPRCKPAGVFLVPGCSSSLQPAMGGVEGFWKLQTYGFGTAVRLNNPCCLMLLMPSPHP